MKRCVSLMMGALIFVAALSATARAVEVSGDYLEMRTCSVYTGPCFANSEVGLTGREAIMAWSVDTGQFDGVDLQGMKVVVALKASDTLGIGGGFVVAPDPIRAVILVDDRASTLQREALVAFVKQQAPRVTGNVVRVDNAAIEMHTDHVDMVGKLTAGDEVDLLTRQLRQGDCVCTNEIVYYPPLAEVENYSPAFTLEGKFNGRGLGTRWSAPQTRSAFLATFGP